MIQIRRGHKCYIHVYPYGTTQIKAGEIPLLRSRDDMVNQCFPVSVDRALSCVLAVEFALYGFTH